MGPLVIQHKGTELDCEIICEDQVIKITLPNGKKLTIEFDSDFVLVGAYPSYEGTVIICWNRRYKERLYDTKTGKLLTHADVKERKITFCSS